MCLIQIKQKSERALTDQSKQLNVLQDDKKEQSQVIAQLKGKESEIGRANKSQPAKPAKIKKCVAGNYQPRNC